MGAATSVASPASSRPFTYKTTISDNLLFQLMLGYMKENSIKLVGFFGAEDSYGENGLKELLTSRRQKVLKRRNFTPSSTASAADQIGRDYRVFNSSVCEPRTEALKRVGYHGSHLSRRRIFERGKAAEFTSVK